MADRFVLEDDTGLLYTEDGDYGYVLVEGTDPTPTPSTLFNNISVSVEVAFSSPISDIGVWDSGLWDTALWGPDVVWTEVSSFVRSFKTKRGFQRDLSAWQAGTAEVVLGNLDGRFSPSNLDGPYVTAGVTSIRPWRPVRIRGFISGFPFTIFRGYALAFEESFGTVGGGKKDAYVTVPCVDELGRLARFDGFEQPIAGIFELTGRRINRILDNAGFTGGRDVDLGRSRLQGTTLAQNTVTELKLTADCEGGALYVTTNGTVTFRDRYALLEDSRSMTSQVTYSDTSDIPGLQFSDCTLAYNGDLVANLVTLGQATGAQAPTVADNESRSLYGDLAPLNRNDLINAYVADIEALANLLLVTHSEPEQLITSLQVKPRRDPTNLFPEVLQRRIRDRIRVVHSPVSGYTIDKQCFVAGVSHEVTRSNWVTTFDLWSATPWDEFSTSLWDTGVWDTAEWFY